MNTALKVFAAGFLSTLLFHQGLFALLHMAGVTPIAPYDWSATAPLGVPKVLSLAFWGGVWGLAIFAALQAFKRPMSLWGWIVIGAIGPTAVALLVVMPLKGMGVGVDPKLIAGGLMLNAAWGLGCWVLMRAFGVRK